MIGRRGSGSKIYLGLGLKVLTLPLALRETLRKLPMPCASVSPQNWTKELAIIT